MNHRQLRNMMCIIMVIVYAAGLVCFFMSAVEAGLGLWAISTVGGFLLLHFIREREEAKAQEKPEDEPPCE